MKILLLFLLLAGCTTLRLQSGEFTASRTAWWMDTEADVTLTIPSCDGKTETRLSANGLKSTVNSEALNKLIGAATGLKP